MTAAEAGWIALSAELDRWAATDRTALFWWRDDDAADATTELARLLDLRAKAGAPLALAVIPAKATQTLAGVLSADASLVALQHGFQHLNHAPAGAKKSEFGAERSGPAVASDVAAGMARMNDLFGPSFRPVFVPPWNRMARQHLAVMANLGFVAVSGFLPRQGYWAAPGITALNTHFDPVPWRGGPVETAIQAALDGTARLLASMRLGTIPLQPVGLLTHHLQQPPAAWAAAERLLGLVGGHPGSRWTGLGEAMACGRPGDVTPAS